MMHILGRLWQDDGGALISIEWVFVATILVLGVTIGLATVRDAALAELVQFANAVIALQPCYSFSGKSTTCGDYVCGSAASTQVPNPVQLGSTPAQPINAKVPVCGEHHHHHHPCW